MSKVNEDYSGKHYLCFAQVVFLLQLCHIVLIWLKQHFGGELHHLEKFLLLLTQCKMEME